jgi:hypothetical protein
MTTSLDRGQSAFHDSEYELARTAFAQAFSKLVREYHLPDDFDEKRPKDEIIRQMRFVLCRLAVTYLILGHTNDGIRMLGGVEFCRRLAGFHHSDEPSDCLLVTWAQLFSEQGNIEAACACSRAATHCPLSASGEANVSTLLDGYDGRSLYSLGEQAFKENRYQQARRVFEVYSEHLLAHLAHDIYEEYLGDKTHLVKMAGMYTEMQCETEGLRILGAVQLWEIVSNEEASNGESLTSVCSTDLALEWRIALSRISVIFRFGISTSTYIPVLEAYDNAGRIEDAFRFIRTCRTQDYYCDSVQMGIAYFYRDTNHFHKVVFHVMAAIALERGDIEDDTICFFEESHEYFEEWVFRFLGEQEAIFDEWLSEWGEMPTLPPSDPDWKKYVRSSNWIEAGHSYEIMADAALKSGVYNTSFVIDKCRFSLALCDSDCADELHDRRMLMARAALWAAEYDYAIKCCEAVREERGDSAECESILEEARKRRDSGN